MSKMGKKECVLYCCYYHHHHHHHHLVSTCTLQNNVSRTPISASHNTTQQKNALPSPPANATESPSPRKLLQPYTATTPHHSSLVIRIVPNPHAPHHNQLSSFRHGTYTCLSYNTIRGTCFAIRTEILLHQSHLRETSH